MRTMSSVWLLGLAGCGHVCEVLEEQFEVTVDSSGEQPLFTWDVGEASSVGVQDHDGREIWSFQCGKLGDNGLDNCIESGVTYGVTTDGTTESTPMEPLEPGVTYVVWVEHYEKAEGACVVSERGQAEFVAP
jgi:hypothetical protein